MFIDCVCETAAPLIGSALGLIACSNQMRDHRGKISPSVTTREHSEHAVTRPPIILGLILASAAALLMLGGCTWPAVPSSPTGNPQQRPPSSVTHHGFLSILADTPGGEVVTVNGFDLQDRHIAAWRPLDVPAALGPEVGIWLPPGQHVVEVQYVRNIDAGISLSRGQVPFRVAPGRTYIVRPQVASDRGEVSFAVIDHGNGFPTHCLPWSILQSRVRDTRGMRPGVTGADILACRHQRRS